MGPCPEASDVAAVLKVDAEALPCPGVKARRQSAPIAKAAPSLIRTRIRVAFT